MQLFSLFLIKAKLETLVLTVAKQIMKKNIPISQNFILFTTVILIMPVILKSTIMIIFNYIFSLQLLSSS